LLNRATQGLYQPGATLQTVILAQALNEGLTDLTAPASNATATLPVNGTPLGCSVVPSEPYTLADAYTAACPAPFANLGERLGATGLEEAVARWTLTTPPPLEIPTEAAEWNTDALSTTTAIRAEAIGQGRLTVSPLQMALVAGALANEGKMPVPRLVLRVQDAGGGWQECPAAGEPRAVLAPDSAQELLAAWQDYEQNVAAHWGVAIAGEGQPPHAWFIGIAPETSETRYAVAVLIEHVTTPEVVVNIGTALLKAASTR